MASLPERVIGFLGVHGLRHVPGVLAVSGGPDSLALAAAFVELGGDMPRPTIAHFNHRLRGAASDADEAFVRSFAGDRGLAFHSARAEVAALADASGENLEDTARKARYRWFAETARNLGARWVATGHTADDQAETILHHLLRGSGLRGLGGMPAVRELEPGVVLVRPFLDCRRCDLAAFLNDRRLVPRMDASNDDRTRTRSRLRHETLPALSRDFNPAIVEVLGRLGDQCRETQELLDVLSAELLSRAELPSAGPMRVLRAEDLATANRAVACEAFRLLWRREGWALRDMTFDDWRELANLARASVGKHDFPGPIHVRRVGAVLQLAPKNIVRPKAV